jgi:molecular chaperone GrpE
LFESDSTEDRPIPLRGDAGADPPAPEAPPSAAAAPDPLEVLRGEKDDLTRSLQRLQADFDNYRKRIERDRAAESSRAIGRAIEGLLPVLDGFERALAAHQDPEYQDYRQGFDLIYRRLWETLSRLGLERIEAEGKPFDPHVHQAVERVDSADHADGIVLGEMQAGYRFRDRVLRPAMVRVAVHPAPAPTSKGGRH